MQRSNPSQAIGVPGDRNDVQRADGMTRALIRLTSQDVRGRQIDVRSAAMFCEDRVQALKSAQQFSLCLCIPAQAHQVPAKVSPENPA